MSLKSQRILIIGGSSGFGLELAHLAEESGAEVTIIGRNQERLNQALSALKTNDAYAVNASDNQQLKQFFQKQGSFHHIVSFVGGAMGGGFLKADEALIRRTIEDKFFANLSIARVAAPFIKEGGSLVFTSGSGGSPATASGAMIGNQAINTMVAGLAIELAPRQIRANAVSPTWTPTGLWRSMTAKEIEQQKLAFAKQIPLGRVATIKEVAQAYLFAMENTFMTGQVLKIDGGVDL